MAILAGQRRRVVACAAALAGCAVLCAVILSASHLRRSSLAEIVGLPEQQGEWEFPDPLQSEALPHPARTGWLRHVCEA
jgi:hypothetical protein